MYEYNILKTQWLILSMGIGVGLVLIFFVTYLAYLKPRDRENYINPDSDEGVSWRKAWEFMPYILVLTVLGLIVLWVLATIHYSVHPPNF